MTDHDKPIGVFDSGVGGLTVAHAIRRILPGESMIYFGDTAHLPYGDKSPESIIYYSKKITGFLLGKQCKAIVIACNTASSVGYEEISKYAGDQALIFNVIDPVTDYYHEFLAPKTVGVIGTKATIQSGAYEKKILAENPGVKVFSKATPLLVPMIEEGFIYDDISNAIIRAYLSDKPLDNVEALILGCTHYPIIKNQIRRFYNFDVEILDSASIVAGALKSRLEADGLLHSGRRGKDRFFVSDYTPYFKKIAGMFFDGSIELEKRDLWR
ncbi:MAG: glutamate racemase [Chlorobi bacterium]|nr:glutamate racemase [Chlorobiota bacterium]